MMLMMGRGWAGRKIIGDGRSGDRRPGGRARARGRTAGPATSAASANAALTAASRRVVADADSSVIRLGLATARMGRANPRDDDLAAIR